MTNTKTWMQIHLLKLQCSLSFCLCSQWVSDAWREYHLTSNQHVGEGAPGGGRLCGSGPRIFHIIPSVVTEVWYLDVRVGVAHLWGNCKEKTDHHHLHLGTPDLVLDVIFFSFTIFIKFTNHYHNFPHFSDLVLHIAKFFTFIPYPKSASLSINVSYQCITILVQSFSCRQNQDLACI